MSEGLERFLFFFLIFLMLCHFMACLWIFTAYMSIDQDRKDADGNYILEDGDTNWIIDNKFDKETNWRLYTTAFYFTVTTITTVGYGDISGTNQVERVICMFLMILGVLFFSFSSGYLTSLISNMDAASAEMKRKTVLLNKINK